MREELPTSEPAWTNEPGLHDPEPAPRAADGGGEERPERATFRDYVERRSQIDMECRQFAAELDEELLCARSWPDCWQILRERPHELGFVLRLGRLWEDFQDLYPGRHTG